MPASMLVLLRRYCAEDGTLCSSDGPLDAQKSKFTYTPCILIYISCTYKEEQFAPSNQLSDTLASSSCVSFTGDQFAAHSPGIGAPSKSLLQSSIYIIVQFPHAVVSSTMVLSTCSSPSGAAPSLTTSFLERELRPTSAGRDPSFLESKVAISALVLAVTSIAYCSPGENPLSLGIGWAPLVRRNSTTSVWPDMQAFISAVSPWSSFAFTSPPPLTYSSSPSMSPTTARC
mmetsp:Transcript_25299/g.42253  ORF Transcript_25299/g.42253 Transcript_25299/m.42253 type:complete len:230 (-) Transcript_25299:119-808(-)